MRMGLFLVFLLHAMFAFAQPKKHALIIAIGAYQVEKTGWRPVNAANDVPLVVAALKSQGFDEQHITIIADHDATRKGITDAVLLFTERINEGDVVYLHYSGHGQQITDDNGDEEDGFDEAIVPIDAHARFVEGVYTGENHIRDDEIGDWLTHLRKRAGANGSVLFVMDACHSGTASRDLAVARGTAQPFVTGDAAATAATAAVGVFGFDANAAQNRAPLVCLYGSSAHELNYETKTPDGKGVGSLSFAFSEAFAQAYAGQSYRELFDKIKLRMAVLAPKQSPLAEGDLQIDLLGGNVNKKKEYYLAEAQPKPTIVRINGGVLMGLYPGTELVFYRLGEEELENNMLATGVITESFATYALVQLNKEVQVLGGKGVVSKMNFGSMAVSVGLAIQNVDLSKNLQDNLALYPFISIKNENKDLLVEQRGAKEVALFTAQEMPLYASNTDNAKIVNDITQRILAYAQANYLRQIQMVDEDLEVHFEFIPITAQPAGRKGYIETGRLPLSTIDDGAGNIVFKAGDFTRIKVVNNGFRVAYITLLDFQPDNVINVLIPESIKQPADYAIKPGEEVELTLLLKFSPPLGTEVFKMIATSEPIDFRTILASRGATRSAGENNPFATLLSASFKEDANTRTTQTQSVRPGACHIYSKSFKIVE